MRENINKMLAKFKTRKFKVGSVATGITMIVIAATVVLNLIVVQLTDKFSLSLDLTQNKVFSLTDQSIDFIKDLNKDVEILVFSDETVFSQINSYFAQANSVLKKYEQNSNKIKIKYLDPVKNPAYLNEYQDENLTENSIIVRSGNKHKIITVQDIFEIQRSYYGSTITGSKAEQELTSAILYVTSENQAKVVMLKGYGEQDSTAFSELLKKNNFNVEEFSVLTQDIPEDARLVIIYAPERDFDLAAIEKVEKFLALNDKNLIYVQNPNQSAAPNLSAFLEKHNIKIKDGMVYETDMKKVYGNMFEAFNEYVDEEYSKLKNKTIPVMMLYCRPIELTNTENTKVLLQFSSTAGVLPKGADPEFDFKGNISGPIPSVVISEGNSEGDTKASKLAVIGSYGALMHECLSSNALNNSAFFVNLVNTMTNRENVGITIESKSLGGEELGVDKATASTIGFTMAIILPIAISVAGIIVYFRRKNK